MIPTFIPTKNRACQLHLLLESLERYCPIFQPNIYYKATTPEFSAGYGRLQYSSPARTLGSVFTEESNILDQFFDFLNANKDGYVALFMDDCVMFRNPNLYLFPDSTLMFNDDNVWAISLRLGLNTIVQDYLHNVQQKPISEYHKTSKDDWFIKYNFFDHHPHTNYGFHYSWDGVIYRARDIIEAFSKTTDFGIDKYFSNTPNSWAIPFQRIENFMSNHRDIVKDKPYMFIPEQSAVVCMNYNSAHPHATTGTKVRADIGWLNEQYLLGKKIDLDSIDFSNVRSCHEELPFRMTER